MIAYLQLLLKGADLEATTEEALQNKLAKHFQQDLTKFSDDIDVRCV